MAVDSTHVYGTEERGGAVLRVDKEGGEWVAIATGEVNPERVLVDESACRMALRFTCTYMTHRRML